MNTINNTQLTYGSIIKVKSLNGIYDSLLLFVNNITKDFIELVDNNGLKKHVFELNESGDIVDENIKNIEVIHIPNEGYALQNKLTKRKKIELILREPIEISRTTNGNSSSTDEDAAHAEDAENSENNRASEPFTIESLKGVIVDLKEDMITVQLDNENADHIYIDFKYSGLDPIYNIRKIKILGTELAKKRDFFIQVSNANQEKIDELFQEDEELQELDIVKSNSNANNEEDYDEDGNEFLMIYSIEQQIDDYIEYAMRRKVNKRVVDYEVRQYLELNNLYVDLEHGIKQKALPYNVMESHLKGLNHNLFYPMTYQGYNTFYIEDKDIDGNLYAALNNVLDQTMYENKDFNVIFKDESAISQQDKPHELYQKSILSFSTSRHDKTSYKVTYPIETKFFVFQSKNKNSVLNKPHYYAFCKKSLTSWYPESHNAYINREEREKKLTLIPNYHTRISASSSSQINGFVFPTKSEVLHKLNSFGAQTLLNKSLHNSLHKYVVSERTKIHSHSYKTNKALQIEDLFTNSPKLVRFHKSKYSDIDNFFSMLNLDITKSYQFLSNHSETNFYLLLQSLSVLGLDKFNNRDYVSFTKIINDNLNKIKKAIVIQNRKTFARTKNRPFKLNRTDNVANNVTEAYNVGNADTKTDGELFIKSMIDFHDLLLDTLINNNSGLKKDILSDSELTSIVEQANSELQEFLNTNQGNQSSISKRVVKKYFDLQEMENDKNKIVLRNAGQNPANPNDHLYTYMLGLGYNAKSDDFMKKLKTILDSNDLNSPSHKDLFENPNHYENLIQRLIDLSVMENDVAYVQSSKQYYVYQNSEWVLDDRSNRQNKKKNMLRVQNRSEDFDQLREDVVNQYIADLITEVHNEQERSREKKEILDKPKETAILQYKHGLIKKRLEKLIYKYNYAKKQIADVIQNSKVLDSIETSPHSELLNSILAIDDEEYKYTLIIKFVNRYCIDKSDPNWYQCINSGLDLLPKYLIKLANAYLIYGNYDSTMNNICKNEGTLSESGDEWIHILSGFTLRRIEFNSDFGFDENGNVFKTADVYIDEDDEIANLDDDDLDTQEMVDIVSSEYNIVIDKMMMLSQKEKQIQNLCLSLLSIFGFSLHYSDKPESIAKEIMNIFRLAKNAKKQKHNDHILQLYSILSLIIPYIQCKNIKPKKTFPGCFYSVNGYPLYSEDPKAELITYVSCIIKKLKNVEEPYASLKGKTEDEVFTEIYEFIELFALKNPYITSMILTKKNEIMKFGDSRTNLRSYLKQPERFRPLLYNIDIKDIDIHKLNKSSMTFENFNNVSDLLSYKSVEFQSLVSEFIKDKKPIISYKFEAPVLINYCCNDMQSYIYEYLTKDNEQKQRFELLLDSISTMNTLRNNIKTQGLRVPSISVVKGMITDNAYATHNSLIYDESTIYQFFIYHLKFDSDIPIPEMFEKLNIQKPKSEYYDKNMSLEKKIKVLKEHGYVFTNETLIEALKINSQINLEESERSLKEKRKETTKNASANDVSKYEIFMKKMNLMKLRSDDNDDVEDENSNGERMTQDEYFSMRISKLQSSLKTYYEWKNSDSYSGLNALLVYISLGSKDKEDVKHISEFMNRLSYFLCNVLLNVTTQKAEPLKIGNDKWDLAPNHVQKINQNNISFYNNLYKISDNELSEGYKAHLQSITEFKEFVKSDEFKHDVILNYTYQKFLLFSLMNFFIHTNNVTIEQLLIDESDSDQIETRQELQSLTEDDLLLKTRNIKHMSSSIINVSSYLMKRHEINYSKLSEKRTKIKQAEKKVTTDYFRNLKQNQRDAEKMKMVLKLGKWGFALDPKRVFKYNKKYYDEDSSQANEILKSIEPNEFQQTEHLNVYEEDHQIVQDGDEQNFNSVYEEEQLALSQILEDGEVAEGMDGDEIYD